MKCVNCWAEVSDPPTECPECGEYVERDGPGPLDWIIAERTPLGIKLVCLVELLGVVFTLMTASDLLTAGQLAGDTLIEGLGWFLVGLALLHLVKVAGLWTLQTWGYKIAVVLYGIGCFVGVLLLIPAPTAGILYVLVYGGFWYYVHSKRRFFRID